MSSRRAPPAGGRIKRQGASRRPPPAPVSPSELLTADPVSNNTLEDLMLSNRSDEEDSDSASDQERTPTPPPKKQAPRRTSATSSTPVKPRPSKTASASEPPRPKASPPPSRTIQSSTVTSPQSISAASPMASPRRSFLPTEASSSNVIQTLAAKLFTKEREELSDHYILAAELEPATSTVEQMQSLLEEEIQARRTFVTKATGAEEHLLHKLAEYESKLSDLQHKLHSQNQAKSDAIKSVEDRHKATKESLQRRVEELQAKLESNQGETVRLLTNQNRMAESSLASQQAMQRAGEVERLEKALEVKTAEMSQLMSTLTKFQSSSEVREQELRDKCRAAEDKAHALQEELNDHVSILSGQKQEITIAMTETSSMKGQLDGIKAKNSELESEHQKLTQQLQEVRDKLINTTALMRKAEENEEKERRERVSASALLKAMEQHQGQQLREAQKDWSSKEVSFSKEVSGLTDANKQLSEQLHEVKRAKETLESETKALREGLEHLQKKEDASNVEKLSKLQREADQLRRQNDELEIENARLRGELRNHVGAKSEEIEALEAKIRDGEVQRRKMHNLIQELRGNIRVVARVRPFLPSEDASEEDPWLLVGGDGESVAAMQNRGHGPEVTHNFSYDRAFHPSQGQDLVFDEVSEFVQSALDGYIVCLFSYGQTGSGKTHTMQGAGSGAMRGIIPRAVEQVAEYKAKLEEQGWEYTMEISFVEVYCERIRDLLRDLSTVNASKGAGEMEHKILRNQYGANYVSNVQMVKVDPNDSTIIEEIMNIAARVRATKKTDMNDTSSRSHSVFTLHLTARNKRLNAELYGQLNLCDLAGSERVDKSNVTGMALTEAKNINRSLAALSHVFESLSKNNSHIPFRDSTLTYLLEPALSGNGKTLMIICLSPTESSVPESVSTLRFGAKVNKVELGRAKRQVGSMGEGSDDTGASSVTSPDRSSRFDDRRGTMQRSPSLKKRASVGGTRSKSFSRRT